MTLSPRRRHQQQQQRPTRQFSLSSNSSTACIATPQVPAGRPSKQKRTRKHLPACWNEATDASCNGSSSSYPDQRLTHTAMKDPCPSPIDGRLSTWLSMINARWLALLCVSFLMCCSRGVRAEETRKIHAAVANPWMHRDSVELIFDRSEAPVKPMKNHAKRQDATNTTVTLTGKSTSTSSNAIASSTSSTDGTIATASSTSTALPQPFDTNLGNNFTTESCPTFFESFLGNDTFKECLPLSMLLQTSASFFAASKSPVLLSQTLNTSCSVDYMTCSTIMSSLADRIKQNSNCGTDYQLGNPNVLQAYNALVAYDPLYHAGCLVDESSGDYCFSKAIQNKSSPTSSYVYYLPLGVNLPSTSSPTCDQCLQSTMNLFASSATNGSTPLGSDYTAAADIIDNACGSQYVRTAVAQTSAAGLTVHVSSSLIGLTIVLLVFGASLA